MIPRPKSPDYRMRASGRYFIRPFRADRHATWLIIKFTVVSANWRVEFIQRHTKHSQPQIRVSLSTIETPCLSNPFSGGGPGEALVAVGDTVFQGTPIIKCQSGITHVASRSGKVIEITDHAITHPSATKSARLLLSQWD